MGSLILPGQTLEAGQAAGQLNQYYGMADGVQNTVTQTSLVALSSEYTIPAGEAYAGAAYELECGGYGSQGSTQQSLTFAMFMGASSFGGSPTVGGAALTASQTFRWKLKFRLICSDGVSGWWCTLDGNLAESGTSFLPGSSGAQSIAIADANTGVHTVSVASAIPVVIQCKWSASIGGPTITCTNTTWKKVA